MADDGTGHMPNRRAKGKKGHGLQLRQRKKSMAELVNEQMTEVMTGSGRGGGRNGSSAAAFDPFLEEEGGMGVAEDYEWGDDAHEDEFDGSHPKGRKQASSSGAAGAGNHKRGRAYSEDEDGGETSQRRLRRRGPLDASLSEGKYAAKPVANVEAMMDDIFGDLDMGDLDAEGEEDVHGSGSGSEDGDDDDGEEGEGAKKKKGRKAQRKAKDLSEEEYMEFLAEKRKKRSAALRGSGLPSFGSVDGEEGAILEQLNSLREAQISLVKSAAAADTGAAGGKGEDALRAKTQQAVRHYIMLYSQLLRIRVKLQPALTKAISLPQYYARGLFTEPLEEKEGEVDREDEEEEAAAVGEPERTRQAYNAVVAELRELLATLYRLTSPTPLATEEVGAATKLPLPAPNFARIHKFHTTRVKKSADECLAYWGSKLVQANSAKLKTISQPLPQQIEAILANMPRLRRKVQKNRAHLAVLAHPDHVRAAMSKETTTNTATTSSSTGSAGAGSGDEAARERCAAAAMKRAMDMADGDVDEEIYEDSDFLRELVRRGGAVAHRLEQQLTQLNRETLPAKEGKRKGFHRITKGREVNYEPRPKLVGFLMSEDMDGTGRNDVVFKSLFQ